MNLDIPETWDIDQPNGQKEPLENSPTVSLLGGAVPLMNGLCFAIAVAPYPRLMEVISKVISINIHY